MYIYTYIVTKYICIYIDFKIEIIYNILEPRISNNS